jgi:hypothetical protein
MDSRKLIIIFMNILHIEVDTELHSIRSSKFIGYLTMKN